MRAVINRAFATALILFTSGVFAQWQFDAKLVPLLPEYCKHTQLYRDHVPGGSNPEAVERWGDMMGGARNFSHMHHYCWGLENVARAAYAATRQDREYQLRRSIAQFDYVINRVTPDFVLLPEILTKKGESLIRLGRLPEAATELTRATELKGDYWPPYAVMSDAYKQVGDLASARQWLEKGLENAPATKALARRLSELDNVKAGQNAKRR